PVLWEYLNNANRKHIYDTWSTLIALKNKHDVFNTEDFSLNTSKLQKSITLRDASMDVIILGNFDIVDETMAINFTKTGTWFEYFSGEELNISETQQSLHLEPGEYRIYTSEKIYDPRGGTQNDDSDNDGVNDLDDLCPNTIEGATVDENGCALFTVDKANFSVKSTSETCPGESNGTLSINSIRNSKFSLHLNEQIYDFRTSLSIEDLAPGTYEFCIYTEEDASFEQCYEFTVDVATTVAAKTTNKTEGQSVITNINITEGTAPYTVYINNTKVKETNDLNFNIETHAGDAISIETATDCEGKFEELITLQTEVTAYPNPAKDKLILSFENNISSSIKISILDTTGKTIDQKEEQIINGSLSIDISQLENGFYFIRTEGVSTNTIKILKQ
ncbi:MAG: T9SS type A sorting domain-containing protein, partial [Flavicella sp.]|nr:T9SS type A sorting domain-containing protein [Flavicella sp.]